MLGTDLMLAHKYNPTKHSVFDGNWAISEKLDGIRAYWDGFRFESRLGNEFYAPNWFKERMPLYPCDGELFAGIGEFNRCVSSVKGNKPSFEGVVYVVYDSPCDGDYIQRMGSIVGECNDLWRKHHQYEATSEEFLDDFHDMIEAQGGEGLMLRNLRTPYEFKRTNNLLKVKRFIDEEVLVVGYVAGKGKHEGRVGALNFEYNGIHCKVGTGLKDSQRESPPLIGAMVTIRYFELTKKGVPRFPSFIGGRDYE